MLKQLDVILMTGLGGYLKLIFKKISFSCLGFTWSAVANLVKLMHDLNFLDDSYVKNLRN
ncbi:hypothetical protein AY605_03565 [Acinetobacter sp. SFD]|nr:hypothetical protein AY605_03565 [Acinetobacter sp. SFD]